MNALLADLKQSRVLLGAEELRQRRPAVSTTGLPDLDALLGGGLPAGKLIELQGQGNAAGTAVAIRLLARFSTDGFPVAVIDRPEAFDPRSAEEAGVDLERLLWCRPRRLDEAARVADAILASGAFPLVVLDLGERRGERRPTERRPARALRDHDDVAVAPAPEQPAPAPRRKPDAPWTDAHWVRLSRRAEAARATLVVLAESERRHSAGAFSTATLRAVGQRARFTGHGPGRTFEGLEVTLQLARNKLGLPPGSARVVLAAPRHFPEPTSDAPVEAPKLARAPAGVRDVAPEPRDLNDFSVKPIPGPTGVIRAPPPPRGRGRPGEGDVGSGPLDALPRRKPKPRGHH